MLILFDETPTSLKSFLSYLGFISRQLSILNSQNLWIPVSSRRSDGQVVRFRVQANKKYEIGIVICAYIKAPCRKLT